MPEILVVFSNSWLLNIMGFTVLDNSYQIGIMLCSGCGDKPHIERRDDTEERREKRKKEKENIILLRALF